MTSRNFSWLFALGAALRMFYIYVPPLWYDENFTLILARLPFAQLLAATAGDVHPPLWYILEWTLYHLVPTLPAWGIRLPAMVFSLGALWLFAAVLRLLRISPTVQTAAFALTAVLPFQLWYAQEGRMYAMLEFLVLFTLYAAMQRKHLSLFCGAVGLLYTQNYGPFYLVTIFAAVLILDWQDVQNWIASALEDGGYLLTAARQLGRAHLWETQRPALAAYAGAGLLWLPWFVVVQQQMTDITGRYWIMDKSLGSVLIILYKLFLTAAVPSAMFFASYTVTFVALILGVISIIRSRHPARWSVATLAFLPLLIAWLVSLVWQPVILFRPLIGASPFLYLVVSWSIEQE